MLEMSTHVWKDVEDYGMWESDLESSIVGLYIHVHTKMCKGILECSSVFMICREPTKVLENS